MSYFTKNFKLKDHLLILYVSGIFFVGVILLFNWMLGLACFVIFAAAIYMSMRKEKLIDNEIDEYISTLSYRVKKVGEEALKEMPVGILLYDEDFKIEWTNPYLTSFFNKETLVAMKVEDFSKDLLALLKDEEGNTNQTISLEDRDLRVVIKPEERLIYFFDVTEQVEIENKYEDEQTALGIIFLDNYEELTQAMDDQNKSTINNQVISILNQWANENGVFLKRSSSEKYIAVFNKKILSQLEQIKFDILDKVRDLTSKQKVPLTLSIGIGTGHAPLPELGHLAQSGLDLALGRGGDQVAIKTASGKVRFYGGKTNPMEKRTRVRARVISHALRELVLASDQIIIMGHKNPDMDAIGACIGVLKIAQANQKQAYIVIDENELDTGIQRLVGEIRNHEDLWSSFIGPEDALEISTDNTLLVVVDTHKPSLVIEERLLKKQEHIVVIDHHRRGEEFIIDPVLVYMEPYASSTAELVTELLEYQPNPFKLSMLESTVLLAGIIVDTKSFTLRTGSRTFDAASYLRARGADTVLVQKFLKEDLDIYIKRASLIKSASIYRDGVAIAKADDHEEFGQVTIAQAADTLLTMSGITASFVISKRPDDKISISARSLGEVNVQIIMEKLDGGGHLTNAATQLENTTIDEVEVILKQMIDEYLEGGEEE